MLLAAVANDKLPVGGLNRIRETCIQTCIWEIKRYLVVWVKVFWKKIQSKMNYLSDLTLC